MKYIWRNSYPGRLGTSSTKLIGTICVRQIQTPSLETKEDAFTQQANKNSHSSLLLPGWLTADPPDKPEAQANAHAPNLAERLPMVRVCQKQQPRLSFHLSPQLTSKVWPARERQWELHVKLKESKQWTTFPLGQTPAAFSSSKSYIPSQAARDRGVWMEATFHLKCPHRPCCFNYRQRRKEVFMERLSFPRDQYLSCFIDPNWAVES